MNKNDDFRTNNNYQGFGIKPIMVKLIIPISISLGGLSYIGTKILAMPSILSNNSIDIHADNSNSYNNLKDSNNKNNSNVENISEATYLNKTLPVIKNY